MSYLCKKTNMKTQIQRLKIIAGFLKEKASNSLEINVFLESNNAKVSDRQLKRDLIDIEASFLQNTEKMIVKIEGHGRKVFQIVSSKPLFELSQQTINTLYLSTMVSPNIFLEKRSADIDLFKKIIKQTINEGQNKLIFNHKQTQFINTHFYEASKDAIFDENIDQLIAAVTNRKYIKINKLINDYTVDNFQLEDIVVDFWWLELKMANKML